jgi:hypothetical protein
VALLMVVEKNIPAITDIRTMAIMNAIFIKDLIEVMG